LACNFSILIVMYHMMYNFMDHVSIKKLDQSLMLELWIALSSRFHRFPNMVSMMIHNDEVPSVTMQTSNTS
jgi:hypothetical protein